MPTDRAPWFPMYPRDFIADFDVASANLEEVGAYAMLLSYAWLKDGLPNDPEKIRKALHLSPKKFSRVWNAVRDKFPENSDGRLRNSRQEEEREKQRTFAAERAESGRKGNDKRWHSDAPPVAQQSLSDKKTIAKHRSAQAQAQAHKERTERPRPLPGGAAKKHFDMVLEKYPNHDQYAAAYRVWCETGVTELEAVAMLGDLERRRAGSWKGQEPRYIPQFKRYLAERMWEDGVSPPCAEPVDPLRDKAIFDCKTCGKIHRVTYDGNKPQFICTGVDIDAN